MIRTVWVVCGWCRKTFETPKETSKDDEYPVRVCPHCARLVGGSRKELKENFVEKKHIHSDSRNGDVV